SRSRCGDRARLRQGCGSRELEGAAAETAMVDEGVGPVRQCGAGRLDKLLRLGEGLRRCQLVEEGGRGVLEGNDQRKWIRDDKGIANQRLDRALDGPLLSLGICITGA